MLVRELFSKERRVRRSRYFLLEKSGRRLWLGVALSIQRRRALLDVESCIRRIPPNGAIVVTVLGLHGSS